MNDLVVKLQDALSHCGKFTPARVPRFTYAQLAQKLGENPDTPVETGELKSSYSAAVKGDELRLQYSAEYAARVYYDPEIRHHTGTGRWFENEWTKRTVADAIKDEFNEHS